MISFFKKWNNNFFCGAQTMRGFQNDQLNVTEGRSCALPYELPARYNEGLAHEYSLTGGRHAHNDDNIHLCDLAIIRSGPESILPRAF